MSYIKFIQQVEVLVSKITINISNVYQKLWSYIGKIRFVSDQGLTRLSKIAIYLYLYINMKKVFVK